MPYILLFINFLQSISALRVLRSANVILSEDTRHSGKLLQYYDIKTPLVSFGVLFLSFLYRFDSFLFLLLSTRI